MHKIHQLLKQWETPAFKKRTFAELDQSYTYGDLSNAITHTAAFLQAQGIQTGDRLVISSRQTFPVAVLFWTCLRQGIQAIMLDPDIGPSRARELWELTEAKLLCVDDDVISNWQLQEQNISHLPIGKRSKKRNKLLSKMLKKKSEPTDSRTTFWSIQNSLTSEVAWSDSNDPEAIAYLLFTSGSTALPKAVQISCRALWANLQTLIKVYGLDEHSRLLNILTVYHTDGIIQGPILAAVAGARWYHPFSFSVNELPQLFDSFYKYEITHFITVPTMLNFMLRFADGYEDALQYPAFKNAITSASPYGVNEWKAFEAKFKTRVVNNYGLTETVVGASYCGPEDATFCHGSIGIPVDCTFKIVDTDGHNCPIGTAGELLIKGENLLTGYLNNPIATSLAIKDGWFHTGDLAYCDENGFYFLVGRIKNLIISGGINIQPETVNAVLEGHPAVSAAACVGIPDEIFGELPVAAIELRAGHEVTQQILTDHCRLELEEAKVPRRFLFVSELPRTGSGKIKYAEVKAFFEQNEHETSATNSAVDVLRDTILQAASEAFKTPVERLDFQQTSTLTLDGWDSLAHLAFVTELESQLKIRLSTKEIMNIASLADAYQVLKTK